MVTHNIDTNDRDVAASWLVTYIVSLNQAAVRVQVLVMDIVLCFWVRHLISHWVSPPRGVLILFIWYWQAVGQPYDGLASHPGEW